MFAALYSVLGLVPLSELVLQGGFLSASKLVAPLFGMLFGPFLGGAAALLGDFVDVAFNRIALNGVGISVMMSDLTIVATAGFAFSSQRKAAIGLPLAVLVLFLVDPISYQLVNGIPFVWFHILGFAFLGAVLYLEGSHRIQRMNPIFIAGVTFGAQLCGQLMGTLAGEILLVQVYGATTLASWDATMTAVFWLYPVERTLFSVFGVLIAVPTLRSIYKSKSLGSTAS